MSSSQDSSYGSLAGMAVGAGIGTLLAPGAGTAIGAGLGGSVGGSVGSLFGGGSSQGYTLPWDQYNQRLGQIQNYQNQLQGATSQYATAVGNMYNTAYNQYLPNAAAAFAGRGLGIDSGAFGAELGRTAASLTSQDLTQVAGQNISNINSVNNQYGNAWEAMFGAANESNKLGYQQGNANAAGLLGTAGGLARIGLNSYSNQNPWKQVGPTDYSSPVTNDDFAGGNLSPNMQTNGAPPNPFQLAMMGTPGEE